MQPLIEPYRFGEIGSTPDEMTYECFTVLSYFWPMNEVTIHGLDRQVTLGQAKALRKYLRDQGITTVRYVRNGRVKIQWLL